MNIIDALFVASAESNIIEATTNVENVWAIENSFLIILSIILVAILIAFANRINKLEDSIDKINERFDGLSTTLTEISRRPCQLEYFGYCNCTKNKKDLHTFILHEDIDIVETEKSKNTDESTKQ